MGYTTNFVGSFIVTPPLKPEHLAYLKAFAETRRMKRDPSIAETLPDPIRLAAGLPIGVDGGYYVGGYGTNMGQDHDKSVMDSNNPPGSIPYRQDYGWEQYENDKAVAVELGAQPGLWCQWTPSDDGGFIVWDEGEKFYEYIPWINYLIQHFLRPWGYKLNGEVAWEGEETSDIGMIRIDDNVVAVGNAQITYNFDIVLN